MPRERAFLAPRLTLSFTSQLCCNPHLAIAGQGKERMATSTAHIVSCEAIIRQSIKMPIIDGRFAFICIVLTARVVKTWSITDSWRHLAPSFSEKAEISDLLGGGAVLRVIRTAGKVPGTATDVRGHVICRRCRQGSRSGVGAATSAGTGRWNAAAAAECGGDFDPRVEHFLMGNLLMQAVLPGAVRRFDLDCGCF